MTTYNTINEAFKNGTGDVFFTINGQYVAVSRHAMDSEGFDAMIAQGFAFLSYEETITAAVNQGAGVHPAAAAAAGIMLPEKPAPAPQPVEKNRFYHSGSDQEVWGYYMEFPDAYGQHL